jgi:hypothetical protein
MRPFIPKMGLFIPKMRPVILGLMRPSARMAPVVHKIEAFIPKMRPFVLGIDERFID